MLPFAIPADTTASRLFREILPRAHAELVPASTSKDLLIISVQIDGSESESSFDLSYEVRGAQIGIREGAASRPHLAIATSTDAIARIVRDVNGAARLVPKFKPTSDVVLLTDPRLLRRLAMVAGSVEIALDDLDGARVAIRIAAGDAARRDSENADVVIEAKTSVIERILDGKLRPEDALASPDGMSLSGKKLVAMQFALALAPLFPR
jgi:hypothetical protein